jgi:hypothetical protein
MTKKQSKVKILKNLDIKNISELDSLSKLRITIITIFALTTISIPLLLIGNIISAYLLIISYLMLFILTIKLIVIKKI